MIARLARQVDPLDVALVAGVLLIVVGVALIFGPAGFIVAGVGVLAGWAFYMRGGSKNAV